MIDLTKEIAAIYAARDEKLRELSLNFNKAQQGFITNEDRQREANAKALEDLANKQAEDLIVLIQEQEKAFDKLEVDTADNGVAINKEAEDAVASITAEFQKELLADSKKEQEEQTSATEALGEKHRYYGMTAKQIRKDLKETVIEEAKELGVEVLNDKGKEDTEANIAQRIVEKLKD